VQFSKGAVGGLVGALGLIVGLVGFMTNAYSSTVGAVVMLAIWIIGGALVAFIKSD